MAQLMIRASDLLGCRVCTQSGRRVGRVHDLRAEKSGDGYLLTALIVKRAGIFARFTGGAEGAPRGSDFVYWKTVTRLEDGRITIAGAAASQDHGD
jgi:sporulation protein YlmC with PRC-barrel domain